MHPLNFAFKLGFIVDIHDPQNRGFLQVRVPFVHDSLADDLLPWARVLNFGGGSFDSGGQAPFEKGSSVGIVFEDGNVFKPIVLGGMQKKVAEYQEYKGSDEDGTWKPTQNRPVEMDTDGPYEAVTHTGQFPLIKTPKGHTILISETSEGEFLRIIDRSGQIIEMNCPVKQINNVENKAQRGDAKVIDGTELPYSSMSDPAYIRIMDLSGNEIYLYSEENNERVLIKNSEHHNSFEMNKDGFFFKILGGQSEGGMNLTITVNGLRLNGQYLVTESLVNWLNSFKTSLTTSTKPGSPEPIFPMALTDFLAHKDITINSSGLKTKL